MNKIGKRNIIYLSLGVMFITLICTGGCAFFSGNSSGSGAEMGKTGDDNGNSPRYYDFSDVLIPKELKVDTDESFIYKTPGFSAGVLILSARVERNSLITFFEKNMTKDNWVLVSSFKSPRTMMLFNKENRWCVINISDRGLNYNTHVAIWVSPTLSNVDSSIIHE